MAVAALVFTGAMPLAQAMELGSVQVLSGLGQPLVLQVPVRLAKGEARRAECLKASVEAGDRSLSAAELTQGWVQGQNKASSKGQEAKLDQGGLIWIRSRAEIAEPVLRVSLGCPQQHLTVFLDPAPVMAAPAAGQQVLAKDIQTLAEAPQAKSVVRAIKVRAERPAGPVLRLGDPGLPPLSLPDAEVPGLRFRFDSDIPGLGLGRALNAGPAGREPKARAERRSSLLMAIDVGRAMGPADLLVMETGLGGQGGQGEATSAPARLLRAQQQFDALQADQRALRLEMDQLLAQLEQRQQDSARRWRLAAVLALGLAVLAAGLYFMMKHKRRPALD
ncbi:hypothetical protein [Paucibacter sp. Y2R2-4]|uniref:hypothetical protein n=1 Tax=Paucibacter sp. Y2R2-4 TaxID=2893553 RepID=UPI0021E3FFDE|nr:hypothetical protein [Paucibacter sp. Y2R2-4]MCV2349863.1 hypothetical protein [Paucibacter sp. Y2R2-4]